MIRKWLPWNERMKLNTEENLPNLRGTKAALTVPSVYISLLCDDTDTICDVQKLWNWLSALGEKYDQPREFRCIYWTQID